MRKVSLVCTALWVAGLFCAKGAPGRGDEVIVIYNTRVPESKEVADYYAEKRHVPKDQIFGYALTTEDDISRSEFRDSLQKPLAKKLADKKLWHVGSHIVRATNNQPEHVEWRVDESKIHYAVLCYGMPLRISEDENHTEPGLDKIRPEFRRNLAAVESELAWLPLLEGRPPLAGPMRNWAYGATNAGALSPTNGILPVTRLDGPSPAIARGLVDKALQAERDGLWGRTYFDLRNPSEPGMKLGDDWIRSASEVAKHLGFETDVDTNGGLFATSYPMSQIAWYCGWYSENVAGPFTLPTVEFMPGAFAYHLHSFSGNVVHTTNRFWVGPLLAKGATITMGCVYEPYLGGTPDVGMFTARMIFQGFTFGQAAYAGQSVISWMTTVVGDPLYCPFGREAEELHKDLAQRKSKLIDWSFVRLANLNLNNNRPAGEVVTFLESLNETKQSAVLSEKLGDLYIAVGKPSSGLETWIRALKLDPTPQQRIRLTLELGDKLKSLDREAEAYEFYQELLQKCPEYPDKLGIYNRLLPLAQKLGKGEDVKKYDAQIRVLTASNK